MKIIKVITVRDLLIKTRILSFILLIINMIVLLICAYSYILFGATMEITRIFAIFMVSLFLFGYYFILGEEGY